MFNRHRVDSSILYTVLFLQSLLSPIFNHKNFPSNIVPFDRQALKYLLSMATLKIKIIEYMEKEVPYEPSIP